MAKLSAEEFAQKLFESVKIYIDTCLERDAKDQEKKMKRYVIKMIRRQNSERF